MLTITDAVRKYVHSSYEGYTALRGDYMNMSAYAQKIQPEIEKLTMKEVQTTSVIVALSRIQTELKKEDALLPPLVLHDISAKSNLEEITYFINKDTLNLLRKAQSKLSLKQSEFFVVTQGVRECCIIGSTETIQSVQRIFGNHKPKLHVKDVSALTLSFDDMHLESPNMLFAILREFVVPNINILEMISTYTEVTFIIKSSNLEATFSVLSSLMEAKERW